MNESKISNEIVDFFRTFEVAKKLNLKPKVETKNNENAVVITLCKYNDGNIENTYMYFYSIDEFKFYLKVFKDALEYRK